VRDAVYGAGGRSYVPNPEDPQTIHVGRSTEISDVPLSPRSDSEDELESYLRNKYMEQ